MNAYAIYSIYKFEMARFFQTLVQSLIAPVISTSLYFIVFGSAIGKQMASVDGVSYGAFIIPGLVMLAVLGQSVANASFGIYFPKFTGTIYEILSAPLSAVEIITGYVGAAASKSLIIAAVILLTARCFVSYSIEHPAWMLLFLVLTTVTFSLIGFIIGIWADGFEKLQIFPLLVITPLSFLGGSFYSIEMLPAGWRAVTYLNPVVYLISGFRWSFYGHSEIQLGWSLGITCVFLLASVLTVIQIFRTGYKIKS